ncbi:MAG: adenylate/guanylate cyclase domain-containing protein [Candidatus Rokuibacteriota bacterium]
MEDASSELRLFLEGVCCDYFLLHHLAEGVPPEQIRIRQEVELGPGAFADIEVRAGQTPPYFVEVDTGYSHERLLESVRRKYGKPGPASQDVARVVIIADTDALPDRPAVERALRETLRPGLALEVWDVRYLLRLLGERFGVALDTLGEDEALALRVAVDSAKGVYAFGDGFRNEPLQATLLWHLACWRVRRLREAGRTTPRAILPPGLYHDVVVVMADLCAYSSYVRDTRDEGVSRRALTSFASKTRYRVINDGGMLYQFQGDSVVGLFGVPEGFPGYLTRAIDCARGLIDVGASVATEWQRQIDQVQPAAGVHVSMTLSDLQVLSLRPLSRTHMGVIGDSINLAARLNSVAGCGELVVSNMLYQRLPDTLRAVFQELPPVDVKNMGRVRAWKLGPLPR